MQGLCLLYRHCAFPPLTELTPGSSAYCNIKTMCTHSLDALHLFARQCVVQYCLSLRLREDKSLFRYSGIEEFRDSGLHTTKLKGINGPSNIDRCRHVLTCETGRTRFSGRHGLYMMILGTL